MRAGWSNTDGVPKTKGCARKIEKSNKDNGEV
jgi:hypothetical protein